uniref:Profilin n=1 Tax=Heterorhabditis bacteriophora TaxID=37862 RepID=A0A1I7XGN2_HETBA
MQSAESIRCELMAQQQNVVEPAMASFIRTCPFEIWKDGDTSMKEIAFKSGLLNSETVFSHAGQNNNEDDLLVKFHNDNAKMRQCHLGKTSILEIPTNSPSISLYFITGIEKSMAGQQLMELIHTVKKVRNY